MGELQAFFDVCNRVDVWPGGVHLEFTGDHVTECLGGSEAVLEQQLDLNYSTLCDPRLNARQSLDLAFRLAELMQRAVRAGDSSMKLAIVGLGLIGGSVGLAARARGDEVTAFDADPEAAAAGLELGAAAAVAGFGGRGGRRRRPHLRLRSGGRVAQPRERGARARRRRGGR